jgi:2-polyprenyl-3-methyl-5-hydroxy-6-metoxy-1,4-benzoquinol methylase
VDYRQRIYSNYRTVQALPPKVDLVAADRWGRAYDTWLRGWLPTVKTASIVDVGCGGGLLLRFFQRHGYNNQMGVDLSTEQLAAARQVCANVHLEGATEFLTARPGAFDMVVSFDLIEHLRKDELLDFLGAAHDALRPGGRLILQTPNCASPFGIVQRYADFTHEVGLTPNSLTWLLRLSGFQTIEAREQGPVVHGLKSLIRFGLWKLVRLGFLLFDLIETGSAERVYTRVFVVSAVKPKP